jgi:hypothetical protein
MQGLRSAHSAQTATAHHQDQGHRYATALRCGNINNHVIRQWRGSQICDDDIINPTMACHGETL